MQLAEVRDLFVDADWHNYSLGRADAATRNGQKLATVHGELPVMVGDGVRQV